MRMKPQSTLRLWASPAITVFVALQLTGCGTGGGTSSIDSPAKAITSTVSGRVRGGQQPISGSTIQLYAVGINGLKSAATPLIAATVLTDSGGNFNITGDWNCTSDTAAYGVNPLLYIVATGGNPGLSSGTNNAAITLMAALGPCNSIGASTNILLNELTTVAAAYALAPFAADFTHIGATGANATGVVNAFTTANLLVNYATGQSPGSALPATATVPTAELNTLANVLAACVNTSGSNGVCAALFAAVTPAGAIAPKDIVGAVLDIAANPALNPTAIYNTASPAPPFQPVLAAAPNDWTVALNFTGGGINAPAALALDASGNVWVANAGGDSVTAMSPAGVLLTGSAGYTGGGTIFGAQGIALDKAGNVWLADTLLSSVVELTLSNGTIQSSTSYTNGGISGPIGIAIDSQNDIWVANFAGASVTELSSAGVPLGGSPLTANGQLQSPTGVGIDSAGGVWVSDATASAVFEFSNNQTLLSPSGGFTDGSILDPQGIALDSAGRAWVAYQGTNAASYFTNSMSVTPTPYTGGGLSMPTGVAVDGQGTVWITNSQTAGSLSELTAAQSVPLSPAAGLGLLNTPAAIAVDASGSLWTANSGDNSISEFVGIATPAVTPLAATVGP